MANKEWEVVSKDNHALAEFTCAVATGGLSMILGGCATPTYTVRNSDGVEKQVTARNSKELGDKIAKGQFD